MRTASAALPSGRCEPGDRGIGELFILGDVAADVAPLRRGISGVEHIRVLRRPHAMPPRRLLSTPPTPPVPELLVVGIADERRTDEAAGDRVERLEGAYVSCCCAADCCFGSALVFPEPEPGPEPLDEEPFDEWCAPPSWFCTVEIRFEMKLVRVGGERTLALAGDELVAGCAAVDACCCSCCDVPVCRKRAEIFRTVPLEWGPAGFTRSAAALPALAVRLFLRASFPSTSSESSESIRYTICDSDSDLPLFSEPPTGAGLGLVTPAAAPPASFEPGCCAKLLSALQF